MLFSLTRDGSFFRVYSFFLWIMVSIGCDAKASGPEDFPEENFKFRLNYQRLDPKDADKIGAREVISKPQREPKKSTNDVLLVPVRRTNTEFNPYLPPERKKKQPMQRISEDDQSFTQGVTVRRINSYETELTVPKNKKKRKCVVQ